MDMIVSIELSNLGSRQQRVGDCFEIRLPSLRSAVLSPNFAALGTTVPMRFLQEDIVILVLMEMSQFRSFGK